jgi:hypothetical protein
MKAAVRDDDGNELGFEAEDGYLEVEFEGRKHPFTCLVLIDYDAEEPEAFLEFEEWIDGGARGGVVFDADFDLDSGRAKLLKVEPRTLEPLIEEFNRDLPAPALARLRREAEALLEEERREASFKLSPEAILSGPPVPWSDVFGPGDAEEESFLTDFVVPGPIPYEIADAYCPSPECQCEEVEIQGRRQIEGSDPPRMQHAFTARVDYEGRLVKVLESTVPESEVETVLEAWRESEPRLGEILEERAATMRDIGARNLVDAGVYDSDEPEEPEAPVAGVADEGVEIDPDDWAEGGPDDWDEEEPVDLLDPPPTVGRNDPCPCGSGKKYKKCCLRRDEERAKADSEEP